MRWCPSRWKKGKTVLRSGLSTTFQPFDNRLAFVNRFQMVVAEEFNVAADIIQPQALAQLRVVPRKRSYPTNYPDGRLPFDTEKQRRYFWAVIAEFDANGNYVGYTRTGAIPNAWGVRRNVAGLTAQFIIENTNPKSKYVYGSLSLNAPGRFQQHFHNATGWYVGSEVVNFWLDAMQKLTRLNILSRLRKFAGTSTSTRRAYTGRRP